MREIEGLVVVANLPDTAGEILFGPKVNNISYPVAEPLKTNGIVPFKKEWRAKKAESHLVRKRSALNTEAATIQMKIPESIEEQDTLLGLFGLIVIEYFRDFPGTVAFHGPRVEGKPGTYPIPGALLEDNNYTPFSNPEDAIYVRNEIIRQATNPATVAQLKLLKDGRQLFLDINFP